MGNIKVIDSLIIDEYLVNTWDDKYEHYFKLLDNIGKKYTNMLFLISAGPLSEICIHKLYLSNPNNINFYVGSSIDTFIKGKFSRPYMTNKYPTNVNVLNLPLKK